MKLFLVCWRDRRGFRANELVSEVSGEAAAALIRQTYVGPDLERTVDCVEWFKEIDISKPSILKVELAIV